MLEHWQMCAALQAVREPQVRVSLQSSALFCLRTQIQPCAALETVQEPQSGIPRAPTSSLCMHRKSVLHCRMCQGLKVGSLISGHVRRLESFGAFIGIDGTSVSALLHISNISSVHVNQIEVGALKTGSYCLHDQATP